MSIKRRIGMLRDTNSSDMTTLSFGMASAASRNANLCRRLVPAWLMARGSCLSRCGERPDAPEYTRATPPHEHQPSRMVPPSDGPEDKGGGHARAVRRDQHAREYGVPPAIGCKFTVRMYALYFSHLQAGNSC